jgi:peptide/nickel transport system substrate-binding protein
MTIDRRLFLQRTGAGLALSSLSFREAFAQKTKRLIGAIEEDPASINPGLTTVISSFTAGCPVYSALTWMDAKGDVHPDLAESWEVAPDNRSYTFRLRQNVKWHDGAPFSAEDVKFSLENITRKLHPWGRNAFAALSVVEVLDPRTVVLRFERPNPFVLSASTVSIAAILPKHLWANQDPVQNPHNRKPVGTGPFILVENRVGDRLIYRRNPNFYIPGQPAFDELVLRVMPDGAARVAALENGEIDMLNTFALPTTEVRRVSRLPNIKIASTGQAAPTYLCTFNLRSPQLAKLQVRHALGHAIDRAFIRNTVMPGLADPVIGPVPSVLKLASKNVVDYAFDVERAKRLLDEAGYKLTDGRRFNLRLLFPNSDTRAVRMADILRQNLLAVGITTDIVPMERALLMQKGYTDGEFDLLIDSYLLGPDPAIGVERLYNSASIFTPARPFTNNSGYRSAEVDRLFDQEKQAVDPEKRRAIYEQIQIKVWADLPILPLFSYRGAEAYNARMVTGIFDVADGSKESFARAKPVA